MQNSNALNGD